MAETILTADRVSELLDYDRGTGKFFWKKRHQEMFNSNRVWKIWNSRYAGKEAGMRSNTGKREIEIDGKRYGLEKLVWLVENKSLPDFKMGYVDGDSINTVITNLCPQKRDEFTDENISHKDLLAFVKYDPESGIFVWRGRSVNDFKSANARSMWKSRYEGKIAGHIDASGYGHIRIRKKLYPSHRLAWFYVHGVWPKNVIDHINGDPSDNRIANLRDVTIQVNIQNMRKPSKSNKTGELGVCFNEQTGKFTAFIQTNGHSVALGYFNSVEGAKRAYVEAKRRYHKGCTL